MAEELEPKPAEQTPEGEVRKKDVVDRFFDNFANVPIKVVDTVIIVSIIALVLVIAIGVITARM